MRTCTCTSWRAVWVIAVRRSGAADDGAHLHRPLDERPAHRGAHHPFAPVDRDDGSGSDHAVHRHGFGTRVIG
jgi:hypothetical protein